VAQFVVDGSELVLHLKPVEKFGGLHGDIRSPLTAIRSAAPVRNPWLVMRGWRRSGTAMRGVTALGTWRHGDGLDFYYVRRMRPAVQVDLATGQFCRLLISLAEGADENDAASQAAMIAEAAGIAPSRPVN
jgi:hypothetical protein